MFERKKPEVLVVGAGPVGLFAALCLTRRDIRTRIVDHAWRTGAHSYALALHGRTLALLEEEGVLSGILPHLHRIHTVAFYERGEKRTEIRLGDIRRDFPFIGVMRQDVLEDRLEVMLREAGVKVDWNHHVASIIDEGDHVAATVDRLEQASFGYAVAHPEWIVARTRQVNVPFVIGSDGHLSRVRAALDIPFRDVLPPTYFAVFEFKTDAELPAEMRIDFEPSSSNVVWPLPDGHCRWSFQVPSTDAPVGAREKDRVEADTPESPYPTLSDEHLQALLRERAPWFEGSVEEVTWRMIVRFDHRLVDRFGKGRMWLAGDAAHMTGPVGVQSMNVGLLEAQDLVERMVGVLKGDGAMSDLADYDHDRLAEWELLLGMRGQFRPAPGTAPWAERYTDQLISVLPASGEDLESMARQLGLVAPPIVPEEAGV